MRHLAVGHARRTAAAFATAVFVACFALVTPGVARAAGSGYYVTFVARSCPEYTDIFANKARNDIQESLKDLGPDSPYNTVSTLVNPVTESLAPQDACSSLPGWRFTLGTGYQSRAVTGPWGSLSKVTNPFASSIVTQDSTPLYDQHHSPIGNLQIAGATTIELTDAERQQASSANQLWAQGGTPNDPVLAQAYPGPQYGFGALRCATDALNGDNVEYIYFPAGVTHVFCYAPLRPAAADLRHDHDQEGRRRRPSGREPVVPVQRLGVIRSQRVHARKRPVPGLLSGGREQLGRDREPGSGLQADERALCRDRPRRGSRLEHDNG